MGSIFKREKSKFWWIKYTDGNGRLIRKSSGCERASDAKRELKRKEGQVVEGKHLDPRIEKKRFSELAELYVEDYKLKKCKTLRDAQRNKKRLCEAFKDKRIIEITSGLIKNYIVDRMKEGLSSASINRELAALKRMFHLGAQQTPPIVSQIPHITMLEEDNVRTGFFTHDEFLVLRGIAPDWLKVMVTIGYYSGMRSGEIRSLTWDRVDFASGFIRLDPGTTKNHKGRLVPFIGDLPVVLDAWWRRSKLKYPECPWVIHCEGEKVTSIESVWKATCEKAGLANRRFHDFRRCGVRNLTRAGVSEHTAMKISGHLTRSVFDRYDIINEQDLREAANRVSSFLGTLSGTPQPSEGKNNESVERNNDSEVIDLTIENGGEGGI